MLKQFKCSRTLTGITDQHLLDEVEKERRDLLLTLQLRWRHVTDATHRLQRQFVEERRLSIHHLDHHDAERPDVHLRTVRLSRDHLRSHPVGSPDERLALLHFSGDLGTEAEVTQLDLRIKETERTRVNDRGIATPPSALVLQALESGTKGQEQDTRGEGSRGRKREGEKRHLMCEGGSRLFGPVIALHRHSRPREEEGGRTLPSDARRIESDLMSR